MKSSEIKALSVEDLNDSIASTERSLQRLKFAHAVSPVENPMQIKDTRRLLARLKTEHHARVMKEVAEKVKENKVSMKDAVSFQKEHSFSAPVKLAAIKKIISQSV